MWLHANRILKKIYETKEHVSFIPNSILNTKIFPIVQYKTFFLNFDNTLNLIDLLSIQHVFPHIVQTISQKGKEENSESAYLRQGTK